MHIGWQPERGKRTQCGFANLWNPQCVDAGTTLCTPICVADHCTTVVVHLPSLDLLGAEGTDARRRGPICRGTSYAPGYGRHARTDPSLRQGITLRGLICRGASLVRRIPELGQEGHLYAQSGFNLIATANTRDKGVNEMSAALKRRFNFETVRPIANVNLEAKIIENGLVFPQLAAARTNGTTSPMEHCPSVSICPSARIRPSSSVRRASRS